MESLLQDRLNLEQPQGCRAKPAILIVDDRQENLLALERLLKQTGAVVVKAQNGNDALKACLNHEFALALLDVNMPEMNGYELAALMRGERIHSAVPIIFVTAAYQQEEQIFQGYSAGAVDYLVKPLREEILLNKVKVFLDIHRQKQDIIHLNAALATRADEQAAANEELQAQSEELQAQSEKLQTQHEALLGSMEERALTIEFLQLVNRSTSKPELIKTVMAFFQQQSGCEAVGLRLHQGEDYPYYETCGFPKEFVRLENSLCQRDATGTLSRDAVGNPVLACMCGTVISGKFDPTKPFFTAKGSFWTNNTTQLLASTTDADRQTRTRNRCNGEGYQSVALLPLHFGEQRIGLLQLNDRLSGRFTPERIAVFERLTDYLSVALEKFSSEEAMREKEKRLALATSATHIGMFDWDLFHNTVRWTQTHEAIFGYAPAATATTTKTTTTTTTEHDLSRWADRVHPEDLPLVDEELRRCLREHQPLEVQYRIIWPDGSLHWIESKGVFLYEKEDTPNRMLGVVMDITERKRTEEALRQSREDLGQAQQVGQIGSWRLNVHRNVLTWSDENHRIFGVEKGTPLTYESFLEVVHPDDRQYVDTQWQNALHGEPYDIEHRLLVDGQIKWVREQACLEFGTAGELLGGFGITQDITERKRAEKALWEGEQRYRTLFENMLSGLAYHKILFDDQGSPTDYLYLATNRAFEDQTGLKDVTGKKVTEVIPEIKKSHPELIAIYGRVATTGKPEKFELYFEPFRKWYVVSAYSQEKDHFITVFDDITERKQAEEYLQIMNATLERMVEKRTQELQETQKQFLHREKLSAIGKLSASIAHEFNNPLQGILSTLKGLKKRAKMDDEDKELLDAAIGEGDRIKNLIRSLQDFNRPSPGKKVMVDMHQSLDSLLLLLKSDFNGKRISVTRDYMERLPQILAVPDQIKQVFLNLLTNAADACRQSGGVITVSTRQEGDTVAVAIQDTGVGIESADLEQIFRPFYTTKAEVKGTGLGLSVSYGIVQNHQGEIRVTSLPGEGATFTVLLPITGNTEEDGFANDRQ